MAKLDNRNDRLDSLKSSFSEKTFKLPDNYFEELNNRIMQSCQEQSTETLVPKPTLWVRLRPIIYMAAMFASIFLIIKFVVGNNGSRPSETEFADNKSSDMEFIHDYIASTIDEYSIYETYQEHNDSEVPVLEATYYE